MTEEIPSKKLKHTQKTDVKMDEMIKNSTHPEMQDIKPDEEFLVIKFEK